MRPPRALRCSHLHALARSGNQLGALVGAALLVLAASCVEREPKGKNAPPPPDPAYVESNILTEAPPIGTAVNADLGGKVVYLGADVDKQTVRPGDKFKVTHYWQVIDPPGDKWRVFTHVIGATPDDWMNVDYTKMRAGHGPDKWQKGQIIRDEQEIVLKGDWKSRYAQIGVGLWRSGSQGLDGRMGIVTGPHDKEKRVLSVRLIVDRSGKPVDSKLRQVYVIRRVNEPIAVDGKADEAAWKQAPWSPDFADTVGGNSIGQTTRAKLLYDDEYLYAFIEASDTDIFSEYTKHDDSLWKADVVELFIDADRNKQGYVELQVNPNNAQFDAWFATTRHKGTDVEWNANMKSAVHHRGTPANRHDTDEGWDVEIAIPHAAVKGRDEAMKVNVPPQIGDRWQLNVVRVDKPKDAKQIRASSMSQITIQDFHALDRLNPVVFADESGGVKASDLPPKQPAPATNAAKPAADEK